MSTIPSLKRKRSTSPEWLLQLRVNPPLPGLSADGLLTVFTHPSLGVYAGIPDNSRFQTLGGIAVEYAIARLILAEGPQVPDETLNEKMRVLLSDENMAVWTREYRLRDRLRFAPEAAASVNKDAELASLFKAYAGAVDREHGSTVLTSWIENMINGPPPAAETAAPAAPPPEPSARAGIFSARLYEMAQLNRHNLEFKSENTGPAHSLTWTMHVHVDGLVEASGHGSSKAAAKEDAARLVCQKRNWKG